MIHSYLSVSHRKPIGLDSLLTFFNPVLPSTSKDWFLYEMQHSVEMYGFYMKYNTGFKWLVSTWNATLSWNDWFLYEIQHWAEIDGFYMKYNTGLKWLVSIWNTTLDWNSWFPYEIQHWLEMGWFLYEIQHWVEMAGFYMKYNTGLKSLVFIWNKTLAWNGWFLYEIQHWV